MILSEEHCIPNKKFLKDEIMEKKLTKKLNPRPHALKGKIIPLNRQADPKTTNKSSVHRQREPI